MEKGRDLSRRRLLYPLWDAGLSIGHQVVTMNEVLELAQSDLPTATTLLDWRLVAGDRSVSDKLLERAAEGLFGIGNISKFLERLSKRVTDRGERYGGSVYLLEPDVKNGIGGLRDLDVACWAVRARFRVKALKELVRIGVLVPREWGEIEEATLLLWRVRNLLHLYAGRRSDRLSFDRQEALAKDLGYGTGGAGVEQFMSVYYRNARVIARTRELILQRSEPPPKRKPRERTIGNGLKLTNEQVSIEDSAKLDAEPALALRLYDEAVRRNVPVYDFARRRRRARGRDAGILRSACGRAKKRRSLFVSARVRHRPAHQAAWRLGTAGVCTTWGCWSR